MELIEILGTPKIEYAHIISLTNGGSLTIAIEGTIEIGCVAEVKNNRRYSLYEHRATEFTYHNVH